MKCFVCPLVIIACLAGFCLETARAGDWASFETKYLKLRYQSMKDLKKFNSQIKYTADGSSFFSFLGGTGSASGFKEKMASKLDLLFEKIQLILDMRKPFKVTINIYPDKKALHETYFKIYKKKKKLRAWYIYEFNTVYLNVQDLSAGMLAHECAHAIIDYFLEVKPPRATAEILARYVDDHLHQEAKTY